MLCNGLEGLQMLLPHLRSSWVERVRMWRERIAVMTEEPTSDQSLEVSNPTLAYPYLLGDLREEPEVWDMGIGRVSTSLSLP